MAAARLIEGAKGGQEKFLKEERTMGVGWGGEVEVGVGKWERK